ncbi:MAG TPA: hypothetical protein DCS93_00860 [Microscillaceae bacterium]|nr:hypothetical protein [Microscillaceae bacterium]
MKKHLSKLKDFGFVCLVTFLFTGLQQVQAQQQDRKFQSFDVVQDYKGAKHLVLHLLVNFQKGTSKVIISQSVDGKRWKEVSALKIQKDYKASFQNMPLSIELDEVKELLKNIDSQVYFRLIPVQNGAKSEACNFAQISKEKLLSLQADAHLADHLTRRDK